MPGNSGFAGERVNGTPRFCSRSEAVIIFSIMILSLAAAALFYLYMAAPRETAPSGFTPIEPQGSLVKAERSGSTVSISGWHVTKGQDSSRQLEKEIVLLSREACYAYPVQYIERPDIAEAYGSRFLRSGYALQADSRFLGKGRYRLYLRYVYNGRKFVSDLNKEIILE